MSDLKGANLQKIRNGNKTYAVTPSLPAGFIKPEQMRIFADTAEKHGLTLKLTSAQRIMMIGLKEEQVDQVWDDLGMNPAFSSPTCVRSIKVCPGTTFCKRGRQDSVQLGMILDKRYGGMEMPHKMKMGVSGCPNSCAESIVRDIGLVGHNEGWRIYVGGNAGGRPRIGDLLAEGLTEEEALRLVEIVIAYFKRFAILERLGDVIERVTFPVFQASIMTEFTGQAVLPKVATPKESTHSVLESSNQPTPVLREKEALPLTGESIMGNIIGDYPHTISVLQSFGMGCLGCNAAGEEPLRKACEIHGMDMNLLLKELNDSFKGKI